MKSGNLIVHTIILIFLLFFGVGVVTAESCWIAIEPLSYSEKIIGTPFTVTGTTNLPVGSPLDILFLPVNYVDVDMAATKETVFARTYVQASDPPSAMVNVWSYEVNTSNFIPPAYQVKVTGFNISTSGQCSDAKPFLVSCPPTPTPTESSGFGILSLISGAAVLACIYIFRRSA